MPLGGETSRTGRESRVSMWIPHETIMEDEHARVEREYDRAETQ